MFSNFSRFERARTFPNIQSKSITGGLRRAFECDDGMFRKTNRPLPDITLHSGRRAAKRSHISETVNSE
jgi:hypothetical protein